MLLSGCISTCIHTHGRLVTKHGDTWATNGPRRPAERPPPHQPGGGACTHKRGQGVYYTFRELTSAVPCVAQPLAPPHLTHAMTPSTRFFAIREHQRLWPLPRPGQADRNQHSDPRQQKQQVTAADIETTSHSPFRMVVGCGLPPSCLLPPAGRAGPGPLFCQAPPQPPPLPPTPRPCACV